MAGGFIEFKLTYRFSFACIFLGHDFENYNLEFFPRNYQALTQEPFFYFSTCT